MPQAQHILVATRQRGLTRLAVLNSLTRPAFQSNSDHSRRLPPRSTLKISGCRPCGQQPALAALDIIDRLEQGHQPGCLDPMPPWRSGRRRAASGGWWCRAKAAVTTEHVEDDLAARAGHRSRPVVRRRSGNDRFEGRALAADRARLGASGSSANPPGPRHPVLHRSPPPALALAARFEGTGKARAAPCSIPVVARAATSAAAWPGGDRWAAPAPPAAGIEPMRLATDCVAPKSRAGAAATHEPAAKRRAPSRSLRQPAAESPAIELHHRHRSGFFESRHAAEHGRHGHAGEPHLSIFDCRPAFGEPTHGLG